MKLTIRKSISAVKIKEHKRELKPREDKFTWKTGDVVIISQPDDEE